ncbi:MAG: hypothetical protein WBD19_00095, partial [Candidatus Acidiferrum sp.]
MAGNARGDREAQEAKERSSHGFHGKSPSKEVALTNRDASTLDGDRGWAQWWISARSEVSAHANKSDNDPGQLILPAYQSSFSPNCTCLEVVAVLVIAPAVPERPVKFVAVGGVNTMRFGVLKFAQSRMLKSSARNCRFM